MRIHKAASAGLAGAAIGLAAPAAVLADHKPGHAPGGQPTGNLTITAVAPTITWSQVTTISGELKGSGNAGQRVELQELVHPFTGKWTAVDTTTTDANGAYRFVRKPTLNTRYRVVSGANTSSEAAVGVRILVPRRVSDGTPSRGERIRFFSRGVGPAHDGATVLLQKRSPSGRFVTVKRSVLRDAGDTYSRYSISRRVYRDGVYRVRVPADADHLRGTSRARRINVEGV